ncbi:MAG TPA: cytochrome c biogenesis protein CcsA [Ignavibacteriaceae bacterium]|nr:cytochrome c biogenesis protein CcsA [Ignavibacteriaceae bacterium]
MSNTIYYLNLLMPLLYLAAFGIYLYDFIKSRRRLHNSKRLILFLTLILHCFYLLIRTFAFDHPPITNVFEIFTVLAFGIGFSYFVLELATDIRGTGPFIIIISFIFQLISSIFIKDLIEVKDVLRSNLLGVHVLHALIGYAGITISGVYGFLYLMLYKEIKSNKFGLIFERLPNLEILEKLSFYSAVIGFLSLSIAIIIGVIWLPQAFPDFSYLDPKLVASSLIWIMYGVGIFAKLTKKWVGKKVVMFSIFGFIIAIISTILTNFLASSFHSFY